jgi:hypothetical protein
VPGQGGRVGQRGDLVDDDPPPVGVIGGVVPGGPEDRVEAGRGAAVEGERELGDDLALVRLLRHGRLAAHHVVGRDRLQQGAFQQLTARHHQVGGVTAHRRGTRDRPGRVLGGRAEPADQLAGQVLGGGQRGRAAVEAELPAVQLHELGEDRLQFGRRDVPGGRTVVLAGDGGNHGPFGLIVECFHGDEPGVEAVFQIVHGVRHVVRPVHDLGFQAAAAAGRVRPDPAEHGPVGLVGAVLGRQVQGHVGGHRRGGRRAGGRPVGSRRRHPRVLEGGVQGGAGEVEARPLDLRLEPGEQPQRLRVALEAAAGESAVLAGQRGQRGLAVVTERRMADVVGQAGGVDQVGVAAEGGAKLAADLRALQRVGEPGPREVRRPGPDHLRLRRQPAQRGAVQDARAVALEGRAPGALGRLGRPALGVTRTVRHSLSVTYACDNPSNGGLAER